MSQRKPFFKEWLEKLQQESWQLELIISGIAILGLREGIRYLDNFGTSLLNEEPNDKTLALVLIMIWALYFGAFISLINLVIHVLTRSLWIGAIGLRYVSGDIDYDNLNYHPRFIDFYKRKIGSFDKYIERLEDFSSVIFSFTFLLVFIILSLCFYFFLFVAVASVIEVSFGLLKKMMGVFMVIFMLGSIIVAFDFVTLGLLKRAKNRYFSAVYFWIYRFFSAITLSFLWRPMLLNFLDQRYTKRLFFLAVPYLLFLIFSSLISYTSKGVYPSFKALNQVFAQERSDFFRRAMNARSFNHRYYDDERAKLEDRSGKDLIGLFSLPSNKLKGPLGEIFVKGNSGDRHLVAFKDSSLVPFEEEGWDFGGSGIVTISIKSDSISSKSNQRQIRQKKILQNMNDIKQILQEAVLLSIDGHAIPPSKITCDYYNHPAMETKGLLCFFPLDSLTIGRHHLEVGKVTGTKYNEDRSIRLDTSYIQVPFIYLGANAQ